MCQILSPSNWDLPSILKWSLRVTEPELSGSPVTIVSLECALAALAERRCQDQSPSEWESSVKQSLKPPVITLRSSA